MELDLSRICEAIEAVVPDRECLVFRDRRLSWRDVGERTRRLASLLADAGLGVHGDFAEQSPWTSRHDHVALYLHNGNEYLEGMLGAYKARTAPVNVNYRYRAAELHHVLADSNARAVVHHLAFAPTLAEVRGDLPDLELVLWVDDGSGNEPLPGSVGYEAALANSSPTLPADLVDRWSGDDLYVCYTGGTTGLPKGVLWRQADFLAAALGIRGSVDELAAAAPSSNLRALPAPPLMHGAAHWNALSCWASGGTVVIQDRPEHLDPADVLAVAARERVTSLLVVGDPFARPLLDELDRADAGGSPYDLSALRHVLSGGAVLSPRTKAAILERLPHVAIVDLLGSTESGRQGMAQTRRGRDDGGFTPASTTVVLDETRRHVLSPGDRTIGWLGQRGPVPLGYLGDEAKTNATFPVVGGERMAVAGDRARYRPDGSVELLGRDSVTINTGGEKVFAEEVETALKAHPGVADAVVCGRPSERWGEEVVGVVAFRVGQRPPDAELRDHCRTLLADYKAPKAIVAVDTVVRSPSGKADYRWAREQVAGRPD